MNAELPNGRSRAAADIVVGYLGIDAGVAGVGKVDEGTQFPLVMQSCTQQGCEAAVQIDGNLLPLLKAGKNLLIGFMSRPGGETITVPASLNGFSAGLKALGL